MRCVDARQLFESYLNGDLSSSMATELQTHRVKCADCRREFALLEVSGHVLRLDDDPVALDDDFTDRLIACMDEPKSPWTKRLRWTAYVGAPLAAAAVVAMAFVGVFDNGGKGQVAGVSTSVEEVLGQPAVPRVLVDAPVAGHPAPGDTPILGGAQAPDNWFNNVRSDVAEKQRNGAPLQRALDLTILQLIDILEEAKRAPQGLDHLPVGGDVPDVPDGSDDTLPDPDGAYDRNADR